MIAEEMLSGETGQNLGKTPAKATGSSSVDTHTHVIPHSNSKGDTTDPPSGMYTPFQ